MNTFHPVPLVTLALGIVAFGAAIGADVDLTRADTAHAAAAATASPQRTANHFDPLYSIDAQGRIFRFTRGALSDVGYAGVSLYYAVSSDGGVSYGPRIRVTSATARDVDAMLAASDDDGLERVLADVRAAYADSFDTSRVDTGESTKNVPVNPGNQPPVASFIIGSNQAGLEKFFNDTSVDYDGTIRSRYWAFGDGTTQSTTSPTTSHTFPAPGRYTVTLTVYDNQGLASTTTKPVELVAPGAPANAPPIADFSSTPTSTGATFVDASRDPDGSIVSWRWNFGDGGLATTQNPTRVYAIAGVYSVALTVTDNGGATATKTKDVTIPIIANFVATIALDTVTFTDRSSTLSAPLTWLWTFGDGTTSTLRNPVHAYLPGTYTATLKVTDAAGRTASYSRRVTITVGGPS